MRNLNEPLKADINVASEGVRPKGDVASFRPVKTETESTTMTLFPAGETKEFQSSWDSIQASFVDEPRKAVEHADKLADRTIQRLARAFSEERARLEGQWSRGEEVSTEDLRVALQRYRALFWRLLSI